MFIKNFLLTTVLVFLTAIISGKDSPQTIILHNDGYTLFQEFRPNDTFFKNAIRDMEVLYREQKEKPFSDSAALLRIIQSKCKYYYDTNTAVVEYLKKKWSQPHYEKMDDEWKDKTFQKDRGKVQALHSLSQGMQKAYNDWNESRNKAVNAGTKKQVVEEFEKANAMLKKTIDAVLEEEPKVFESISKELQVIKMSK
ncbi:MAG TPA: hypothetical protein PKG52_05460 [bacterium]|nr:hypothetical protein [bacterium]HPS29717.1 hypothetical protein [bacterium]